MSRRCIAVASSAAYLRRTAPLSEGDTRAAPERAADHYDCSAQAAGRAFGEQDVFFGPWSRKTIADWTPQVRAAEADRLETVRRHDSLAIAEIEKAIRGK